MSVQVLGDTIDFTTNISFTKNLILDVGKNITFMSGSSFVVSGTVYFPDSSKVFIGNNTSTLSATLADGIPKGCIMMWYNGTIPTNWVTCDGNNGTAINGLSIPDLRGMFIMGSGTDPADGTVYNVGNTGGNVNHSVRLGLNNFPSHRHTGITSTAGGNHTHSSDIFGNNGGSTLRVTRKVANNARDYSSSDGGNHRHTLEPSTVGESIDLEILPVYYSLIYIIKTV